tara:strand:+ start:188 stop:502 length:315 start_codon:yes stop_codon:yes gene_type:complete
MKKVIKNNSMLRIFKFALGGMLGVISAQVLISLFSIVFIGIGFIIIYKFNKKDENNKETKLFEDIQPIQYIGIVLCLIGLLPWIQYLFIGFMEGAGIKIISDLF